MKIIHKDLFIKLVLVIFFMGLSSWKLSAQNWTTYTTDVCPSAGTTYTYYGGEYNYTSITWVITGSYGIISGTGLTRSIRWFSDGTIACELRNSNGTLLNPGDVLTVKMYTTGTITGPVSICSGSSATYTAGSSYGAITWQKSINSGGSWSDVGSGYSFTETPSGDAWYRARINACLNVTSNIIQTTIASPSVGGTASLTSASSFCINPGSSATATFQVQNYTSQVSGWYYRYKDGPSGTWTNWTWNSGGGSASSSSYAVSPVSGSQERYYEFRANAFNSPCAATPSTSVAVTAYPTVEGGTVSGITSQFCGSGSVNLSVTGNWGPNGSFQISSQTNGGVWTDFQDCGSFQNLTTTTPNVTGYKFRWRSFSSSCGTDYSNEVSTTVYPATMAGTLTSDVASFCAGGTVNFTLSGAVGESRQWQERHQDGTGAWTSFTTFSTANGTTNNFPVTSGTAVNRNYEFKVLVTSGTCAQLPTGVVAVVVYPYSVAGTISPPSNVCNSQTISLNHSGFVGTASYMLRSKIGAGGLWSGWIGTSASPLLSPSGSDYVTYEFQAFAQSGSCSQAATTIGTTIVYPSTSAGTLTRDVASFCAGGTVNFTLSGAVGEARQWQERHQDGTGAWTSFTTFSSANTSVNSFTATGTTSDYRNYEFKVLVTSGTCAQLATGVVSLIVYPSSAGGTLTILGTTEWYGQSVSNTLSTTSAVGTVSYEYSTNGTTWNSASSTPTNLVTTTQFRAKAISGTCAAAYSTAKTIYVYPSPSVTLTGPGAIPIGGSTLLSTQTTFSSYQWMKDNVDIAGVTGSNYTVTEPGTYTVKVKGSATAAWATAIPAQIGSSLLSQLQGINYLVVTNLFKDGVTTNTNLYTLKSNEVRQSVTYMDGFGRTVQQNAIGQSPARKDLIQPYKYDFDGRQEYSYLPYASTQIDGKYIVDPFPNQLSFYQSLPGVQADSYPYAKSVFDNSPLSRVLEQGAPGTDWQPGSTHTVRQVFNTNIAAYTDAALKNVRKWTIAGPSGTYADNLLGIATTTDENGNKVWTFSDNLGRIVLKRVQLDETLKLNTTNVATPFLETYYVYDSRGNLAIQVPPKATAFINNGTAWSTSFRDQWCFTYTYDERNRLVEKKVPDAAVVYYGYDNLDRLVLVQDGLLRTGTNKRWMYIKYDIKGRPIMTGIYINNTHTTRTAIQTNVLDPLYAAGVWYEERGSTLHGYTNLSFPTSNYGGTTLEVYSVNYYDNYDFDYDVNQADEFSYATQGIIGEGTQFRSYGLPTGSKRLVLGTSTWLYNYVFYDKYGRVIQVRSNNHLSATVNNLATNIYDFEGKLLQSVQYHTNGTTPVTVVRKMDYDHAGRLTKVSQKIDALAEVALAHYEYNEMGQLLDKKLLGPDDSYLQSIDYTYNIRGWLKGINDTQMINSSTTNDNNDLFGLELAYNNVITGLNDQAGDSRYYNGNISASRWRMKVDGTGQYDDQKGYKFNYDKADRLKAATYRGYKNSAWAHEQDIYNESMTYDHNGNIITLQRNRAKKGSSAFSTISEQIDNLAYTYVSGSGNKLTKVEDATGITAGFKNGANVTTEYTYHSNGSMNSDSNKGITSTTYNDLGKPTNIVFSDGRKINYTYDGAGTKLTVKNYNGATLLSTTDYVDGYVYENSVLNFFGSPEGRVVKNGGNYEYQFAIGDNQNNTRLLYGKAFEGSNLLAAQAECTTTSGFPANGTVTISAVTLNSETYVKCVAGLASGTPGIYPIGGTKTVVPGEKYTFKVKGYTEGSDAWLYVWSSAGDLIWRGTVLAKTSTNETWISNDVIIPAGVTQINLGVLWENPTMGSVIYLNKVGLYKHNDDDYTAGFEAANTTTEDNDFQSYYTAKINNSSVYARTGTSSYRLTASSSLANEIIGPAKSLRVYTGDVIKMEAYARYLAPTSTSSGVAAVIASAINAAFGNVAGGGTDAAFQSINSLFTAGPLIGTATFPADNTTAPKAYLNYILFDDNFVPYDFGYDQVGEAGALPGGVADKMALEAKVRKPGYLYIYLSNENPTIAEVYFDDLSIKHVKSPVIQYNDYYAYGLQTGNSWTRDNTKNNFLYNEGSEQNPTSGNYDHFFRNYDPALARFVQVDPLASKYHSWSTYNYAYADPVYYTDPSGAGDDRGKITYNSADANQNALSAIASGSMMFGTGYNMQTYGSGGIGGSMFAKMGIEVWTGPSLAMVGIAKTLKTIFEDVSLTKEGIWVKFPYYEPISDEDRKYLEENSDGTIVLGSPGANSKFISWNDANLEFVNGFLNSEKSNEVTFSLLFGGWGLVSETANIGNRIVSSSHQYKYASRFSQLREIAQTSKNLKIIGTGVGALALVAVGFETLKDGNVTAGDAAKMSIAAVSIAFPVFGIVYGLADLTVQFTTGTNITDRIANGLDSSLPNAKLEW